MHSVRKLARTLTTIAVLGLLAAACSSEPTVGSQDDDAMDSPIQIMMRDFAFDGVPEQVPAGTRLTVVNDAEQELHEVVAFRLPDGDDRTVAELTQLAPPDLIAALGEPATVLLATPGGPVIPAVGDGTLTEPGRYALMCFIPTGVDPKTYLDAAAETDEGPPQVDGGPPHFVHGMYAELIVG